MLQVRRGLHFCRWLVPRILYEHNVDYLQRRKEPYLDQIAGRNSST